MKRAIQSVVALAIAAGALWLTLRDKPLERIWIAAREADYRYLLPYVAILATIHLVRTVRWGILLEPIAKVSFGRLNAASAVGFMALVVLPFRLGEFARPYLVAGEDVRASSAMSTIVFERVVDGLFTALLLVVALLAVPASNAGVAQWRVGGAIVFVAFLGVLAFLGLAYRSRAVAVRIVRAAVARVSEHAADRIAGMLDAFIHGLRLVPGGRKMARFLALTAAYWGLNAWGMQVLARGFGMRLGMLDAFAVLGVLVVGVMIPAPPGMIGTFQAFVVAGLSIFVPREVVQDRGVAYAFVIWGVQLAQQIAFGLFFLFSRHIRIGRLFGAPRAIEAQLEAEEAEYADGDRRDEEARRRDAGVR